jgi:hypothetical protein
VARSAYIYVACFDDIPYAAFTVKHELITWLSRKRTVAIDSVRRLPDGKRGWGYGITPDTSAGVRIDDDPEISPWLCGHQAPASI